MNNKIELKHLAPYSPYGLKCEILDYQSDYVGEKYLTIKGYYLLNDKPYFNFHNGRDYAGKNTTQFKPILRPLSDLTLDIINKFYENKSENGIILKKYITTNTMAITLIASYKMMGDDFTDFIISRNSVVNTNYWLVKLLLKNHFDIFGLIEKGLAIDINTL
jgi:hypothetical protein